MTLLEHLRVVADSLRDFDHAADHIEVDTRDVSALLTDAANAIEATTKERDAARAEVARYQQREEHFATALRVADGGQYRNDWNGAIRRVLADRDAARAEVARLLALATGPHINDEGE